MQKPKSKNDKPGLRSFFLYLLILIALISVFRPYWVESTHPRVYLTFSQFVDLVDGDKVKKVVINQVDSSAMGDLKDGTRFRVNLLQSPSLISTMKIKNVDIEVNNVSGNWFSELLGQVLVPILLFAGIWFFIFRQAQGMNSQAMAFGKSKVKMFDPKSKKISFKDVAGVDEAIEELKEIVDFLKSPTKFHNIGAKIPKGVLLMGPPGCGKTLLARAVAGEANVSFFSISGSDFVEMFVGVGASRVRDLFNQAKKNQPAIVFMDEIDAVGRHRGAGLGGGHDEREQTLNQLLVEMDGFDNKSSVIVIAATNRADVLDPALLRPGRFDRQVVVDAPDVRGRERILEIHCRNVKLASDIKLDVLAKRTPGFTGADLANLVNEGALLAARHDKKIVDMSDLEDAIDRVIAGPEKKSKIMQPHDREVIAYHETGHALVAHFSLDSDPVHKISILPRGMALGYTLQLPDQDKYLVTKQQLKNELAVLMGGRTAEEMIFGEITTGASNDIERATSTAHKMVCTYGMSSLGNRTFGQKPQNVFLGRDLTQHSRDFGDHLADNIDKAMNTFIDDAHEQAKKILIKHEKKLHEIARALLKEEVLDGELLKKLLGEKKLSKVKNRSQGGDVSDNSMKIPPVLNPGASLA